MAMKNPGDVAKKWSSRLGGATESIRQGIQRVEQSPGLKAVARKQAYLDGVANNVDKWTRKLSAMKVDEWREAALTTGINRITSGLAKGTPKMEKFMVEWLPFEETLKQRIAAMPKGSLEASIARATEAIRYNKSFRRSQ